MSVSFWNDRYRAAAFAYGREPNDFVREQAASIAPGRVLCLAEGEGRNAVFLASLGHAVTVVDYASEGLRKASLLAEERGVRLDLVEADLAAYEPDEGRFSAVVATWAHLPPAVRQVAHARAARALAPGGRVVLEAYTPAQLAFDSGGPRDASLLMTADLLRADFAGLIVEIAREVERDVDEGLFHRGRSASVQFAAVRPAETRG